MSPSSSPPGDTTDDRIGTVLSDRYRLDALLGEGGMGRVYAAEHVMMRKKLAVKILHRELTMVPEVVKRFEREAMAAANIEHPNVAAATDFGKLADGSIFMVMEFVEGRNLRDEIAEGPMSSVRALRISRQIASALESAHALDIVHRDLKPENVLLVAKGGEQDFVKVLDFGIAKVPIGEGGASGGNPITKVGMVFGTPEYMAPEQALGQAVDGRADLYALGVITYEMLAGVRPFSSASQTGILGQQLSRPVPPFVERAPGVGVPPAVEQVVLRLLEREASQRFQTSAEVSAALDGLLGSLPGNHLFTQYGGSAPRSLSGTGSIPDLGGSVRDVRLGSIPDGLGSGSSPELTTGSSPDSMELPSFPFPSSTDLGTAGADSALLPAGTNPPLLPAGTNPALTPTAPSGGTLLAGSPRAAMGSRPFASAAPSTRSNELPAWVPAIVTSIVLTIDDRRRRLPPPLNQIPALGYLGGLVGLVGVGFVAGVVLVVVLSSGRDEPLSLPTVSASSAPSVVPVVSRASEKELSAAMAGGVEPLKELSRDYPEDAAVLVALARAQRDAKQHLAAVASVKRALELAPETSQDADVAAVLWVTAQDAEAREPTFALLEGPMATRGADIAYDLAVAARMNVAVTKRAQQYLATPKFEEVASPAVRVAAQLRRARKCEEIHALLDDVAKHGDDRVLPRLYLYQQVKSCKIRRRRVDCWPCLRKDTKLHDAVHAVRSRKAKPQPAK